MFLCLPYIFTKYRKHIFVFGTFFNATFFPVNVVFINQTIINFVLLDKFSVVCIVCLFVSLIVIIFAVSFLSHSFLICILFRSSMDNLSLLYFIFRSSRGGGAASRGYSHKMFSIHFGPSIQEGRCGGGCSKFRFLSELASPKLKIGKDVVQSVLLFLVIRPILSISYSGFCLTKEVTGVYGSLITICLSVPSDLDQKWMRTEGAISII